MKKRDRKIKKERKRVEAYDRKIVRLREDSVGQSRMPYELENHEALVRSFRMFEYGQILANAYAWMPKIEHFYSYF